MSSDRKIRVLIVDDSAIVRKVLTDALAGEPDLEVVGTACDPYVARDKIQTLKPDVLTLDIEMPRMDGITFLKKLMHFNPLPAIIISSLAQPSCRAAIEALASGAVEVLAKPGGPYSVGELRHGLPAKIRAAALARVGRRAEPSPPGLAKPIPQARVSALPSGTVIAIGASTGGTEAIARVLSGLPSTTPPVLIVQHIPPVFSKAFATRLNDLCAMEVREARDGEPLQPGLALVAPGDFHMLVRNTPSGQSVSVRTGPRVCYQRPSVDVLFFSAAEAIGRAGVGVLLTGMGSDGAQGLLKMRQSGARTLVQDEATSVVYGMPREAVILGAAQQILPLSGMADAILESRHAASGARTTSTLSFAVDAHTRRTLQ